jgi:hypothetical protein
MIYKIYNARMALYLTQDEVVGRALEFDHLWDDPFLRGTHSLRGDPQAETDPDFWQKRARAAPSIPKEIQSSEIVQELGDYIPVLSLLELSRPGEDVRLGEHIIITSKAIAELKRIAEG